MSGNVVAGFDNFLRDGQLAASLAPELVLRFGAPPVSKALSQFLELNRGKPHYLVCDGDGWSDPDRTATRFTFADPTGFCEDLTMALGAVGPDEEGEEWSAIWRRAAATTEMALANSDENALSEPQVFRSLSKRLPEGSIIYAGNSMPVRDLDSFFPASDCRYTFLANRGTSGIDGVVSSALGAAAGSGQRVVLVIGDLSFYHDTNGLLAIRRFGLEVTIVLINNDGGGIFSFLPQSEGADDFEELFGTPHGLDFRPAAEMHGLTYACPDSAGEFEAVLEKSFAGNDSYLIEVKTDRAENVLVHNEIWARVQRAVRAVVRP